MFDMGCLVSRRGKANATARRRKMAGSSTAHLIAAETSALPTDLLRGSNVDLLESFVDGRATAAISSAAAGDRRSAGAAVLDLAEPRNCSRSSRAWGNRPLRRWRGGADDWPGRTPLSSRRRPHRL